MLGWLKPRVAYSTGLSQLSLERVKAFAVKENLSYAADSGASLYSSLKGP